MHLLLLPTYRGLGRVCGNGRGGFVDLQGQRKLRSGGRCIKTIFVEFVPARSGIITWPEVIGP